MHHDYSGKQKDLGSTIYEPFVMRGHGGSKVKVEIV